MSECAEDVEELGRLVHAHRAHLAGVARGEGLSPEDALDAVQEAFQKLLTLPRGRGLDPDEARRFLAAATRNIARNHRRLHAQARPHTSDETVLDALPDEAPGVDALLEAAVEKVKLTRCMRTLAEVQRAVVALRVLEDVPGEDVARFLGLTPGHVAVLLHRAKRNLLACMLRPQAETKGDADAEPVQPVPSVDTAAPAGARHRGD